VEDTPSARIVPFGSGLSGRAKALLYRGTVRLDVKISPQGTVRTVSPIGGNPALVEAAVAAVKKWKYAPASSDTDTQVTVVLICVINSRRWIERILLLVREHTGPLSATSPPSSLVLFVHHCLSGAKYSRSAPASVCRSPVKTSSASGQGLLLSHGEHLVELCGRLLSIRRTCTYAAGPCIPTRDIKRGRTGTPECAPGNSAYTAYWTPRDTSHPDRKSASLRADGGATP